jgi:sentrin-specific protease 1
MHLQRTVHIMTSHFWAKLNTESAIDVMKWTTEKSLMYDILEMEKIIIPVNLVSDLHWVLVIVDIHTGTIWLMDSCNAAHTERNWILKKIEEWLHTLYTYRKKTNRVWKFKYRESVQQQNGFDCGVYMCVNAAHVVLNCKIEFTHEHMKYYRRRILADILHAGMVV